MPENDDNIDQALRHPDSDKAKEYLKELSNAFAEALYLEVKNIERLNLFYQQLLLDEKVQAENDQRKAAAVKQKELQAHEAYVEQARQFHGDNLVELKHDLEAKQRQLENEVKGLQETIATRQDEIKSISNNYQVRENKLQASLAAKLNSNLDSEKLIIYLPASVDGKIVGMPLNAADALARLKNITSPTIEEKLSQPDLKPQLMALVQGMQSGRSENVLVQMANKENVLMHIRMLNALGGGDVTPAQMIALNNMNKELGKVLKALNDPELKLKAKDIGSILGKLQEIDKMKVDMAHKTENIARMKGLISEINEKLGSSPTHSRKP